MSKQWFSTVGLLLGAALILSGCASDVRTSTVAQLSSSQDLGALAAEFQPGYIISDQEFFDTQSLSEAGIQSFLNEVPCTPQDNSPCLAEYETVLPHFAPAKGIGHCNGVQGEIQASAAVIIERISTACGISPKVMLVLMQKEQSLLTKPSAYGYQRATGYGCPDTTGCDSAYYGFVNQLYNAAWQFRQYSLNPNRSYHIGTVQLSYSPDESCGSSSVTIRNQATANLYNYTPYQPNRSAIGDPAGDGDACSSWGNLNFWLLWNIWFGNPLNEPIPVFFPNCVTHEYGARCTPYDPTQPFSS